MLTEVFNVLPEIVDIYTKNGVNDVTKIWLSNNEFLKYCFIIRCITSEYYFTQYEFSYAIHIDTDKNFITSHDNINSMIYDYIKDNVNKILANDINVLETLLYALMKNHELTQHLETLFRT